jgi:hypothetical protein
MATRHGAKQQKKLARQKAKRAMKKSNLLRRTSKDPTIRLREAAKWPVVHAFVSAEIWKQGLGSLVIARQDSPVELVYALFLVDVYCLGVKNAFWRAGSSGEFQKVIDHLEERETMRPISPACLVKIIQGAVAYAESFGFLPHPDYRHAAMLLAGIDPTTCPQEFQFGKDGKPLYINGPNETVEQAEAIMERIQAAGGHFMVGGPGSVGDHFAGIGDDDDFDALEEDGSEDDEDDSSDEPPAIEDTTRSTNPSLP